MTNPNPYQPQAAPPGYVQMPGGYAEATGQQPVGGPAGMPQVMQQYQQQPQAALPPQMQQPQHNPLNGAPSPLSQMAPVPFQQRPAPQQQQFQQAQPQSQYPPQQQFAPQQPPAQQVLSGPGVPQELQGRTLQEAISIYNGMRQTHLQQMASAQQQAPAQQQAVAPQTPVQGQSGAPAFDWRNPGQSVAAVVREEIQNTLVPMLAPIAQRNAMDGVQQARQQAASQIGVQRWTAMEPAILQALEGADPRALGQPNTWLLAAQVVAGRQALNPQQQVPQQQVGPGGYPAQVVQPGQNPMPNMNSFFTEQPNQAGPSGGQFQLSNAQREAASAMGVDPATYAAWAVGIGRNG